MTRERVVAVVIQYVKVTIPSVAGVAFIARVMYQSGTWSTPLATKRTIAVDTQSFLGVSPSADRFGRRRLRPYGPLWPAPTPIASSAIAVQNVPIAMESVVLHVPD